MASQKSPSARHQVEDQDNHRDNQQNMYQAAGNMETEAQKPQNQKNNKNSPKHTPPFRIVDARNLKSVGGVHIAFPIN
jgi:hypothetical protein